MTVNSTDIDKQVMNCCMSNITRKTGSLSHPGFENLTTSLMYRRILFLKYFCFFKYYIYRCKCEQILPNIESIIKQFLYVKNTEKIAVGKCKERIFQDK